jgi:hypothetical protein
MKKDVIRKNIVICASTTFVLRKGLQFTVEIVLRSINMELNFKSLPKGVSVIPSI